MASLVNWPLAAVGAEHHGQLVRGFGDDRHRPRQLPPVVIQVRQQLHHGPPVGHGAGHGLGTGVQAGQPGQVAADKPAQLPVAADLARARIIDHHLTRPGILQKAGITFVQRGEVLRDRISLTRGAGLLARQLHSTYEVRKPRHRNTPLHSPPGTGPQTAVLPPATSSSLAPPERKPGVDQRAGIPWRPSSQSAQGSIGPTWSSPAEAQGSRDRRALISFSSAASTACRVCSPSPIGPPRMTKPSSTSRSMKAACSSQPSWSRIRREGSQPGPWTSLTAKLAMPAAYWPVPTFTSPAA